MSTKIKRWTAKMHAWRYWAALSALAVSLFVFIEVADENEADDVLHHLDRAVIDYLGVQESSTAASVFALITRLGDGLGITLLGVVVGLVLLFKARRTLLYLWAIALCGSGLLNRLLKSLFARDRPEAAALEDWSFPSGHAMNSLVAYGMLAYLLIRVLPPAWRLPAVGAAMLLILLIGLSRIVLKVHYPSDVIAGFAAGLAWLALVLVFAERSRSKS